MNCENISKRIVDYEHKLPSIPFMPDCCHCHQIDQILWLNHKELEYMSHSQTSGAPYTDTFYVKILHRIT
jgi:hypothetical protein